MSEPPRSRQENVYGHNESHSILVGKMPYMPRTFALLVLSIFVLTFVSLPVTMQSTPDFSEMYNTTVTLYYYDNANGTKGDIVPMPDNPQHVNMDPALAAPGMYTFSQVPSGQWYYLEADHQGYKWYTLFYMGENVGTKTANVHIPPLTPLNATATPLPGATLTPTPAPSGTPFPTIREGPKVSPGMPAIMGLLAIATSLCISRKRR